jgi:hypothetical protein
LTKRTPLLVYHFTANVVLGVFEVIDWLKISLVLNAETPPLNAGAHFNADVKITLSTPRIEVVTVSDDQVSLSPRKDALTYERHVISPHKRLLKTCLSTDPAGFRLPNFLRSYRLP